MPEVRRGSLHIQSDPALTSPAPEPFPGVRPPPQSHSLSADRAIPEVDSQPVTRRHTIDQGNAAGSSGPPRKSLSYAQRPQAEAYYDSRAATRSEWKRRAKTLQEYYDDNPQLLPQLPFTWHHGWKRWKLWFFAFAVFVDASAVPIALYYGMKYAGNVEGWIIFAVVTTIWGGPTYLEFAVRTLRLIKKERFFRPLGTDSRWCFDMLTWASSLTIFVVTALFIIGSAPHIVWLRVLCMPAPAILYCLGGVLALLTLYNVMGWPAPFRISSTAKGEKVSVCMASQSLLRTFSCSLFSIRFCLEYTISSRMWWPSMPVVAGRSGKLLQLGTRLVPASDACFTSNLSFGPYLP